MHELNKYTDSMVKMQSKLQKLEELKENVDVYTSVIDLSKRYAMNKFIPTGGVKYPNCIVERNIIPKRFIDFIHLSNW